MEAATTPDVATASEENPGERVGPLENPAVRQDPGDPLLEPLPAEPGVNGDGGAAAPLENPGRARG